MKIVSLLENTAKRSDMQTEHGLSLYIESAHRRILFDMGQTDLFLKNAEKLDIDLSSVDFAVLSHGHNDHGGGLSAFLEINQTAPVYLHRTAFVPRKNAQGRDLSLDPSLADHPRLIFTDDTFCIGEGITLSSCGDKPRPNDFGAFGLMQLCGEIYLPDRFLHEQYLLIEENGTRVLFSGCSHKGILDIVTWFSPDVLIGGFHVSKMPQGEMLARAARTLADHPTEYHTCHCTGTGQYTFMKQFMPRLHYLACGEVLEIPT